MLQVENTVRQPLCKMPVDYTSYLLSSSPPGFDSIYTLSQHFRGTGFFDDERPHQRLKNNSMKPIIVKSEQLLENEEVEEPGDLGYSSQPVSPTSLSTPSPSMGKKQVTFADDKGLALVAVRVIEESPKDPPNINPDTLASITKGAIATVADIPPLKLDFVQPASDYLAFRSKLQEKCVSLENAILNNYNLMGTIKLKNISFEKKVFIRLTIDSWETSKDIRAKYVKCADSSGGIDTFSFETDIPPNHKIDKTIEFCVCFKTENEEFWDSNGGCNYKIAAADWRELNKKTGSSNTTDLNFKGTWTEFAGWSNIDTEVPYY
ncbi:unnamed protein product [Owenia fusiformis]|uniref:CBM21 domain-containing protein n=1 Tax=Owenia fusiformis TaxID=6347 RepID=A0A8S4NWL5_OWEFU|nr:unnamed protein product [Owenia fusiformis]